jgi:hypothetical protein
MPVGAERPFGCGVKSKADDSLAAQIGGYLKAVLKNPTWEGCYAS